jgi:bacteriocin-like protein
MSQTEIINAWKSEPEDRMTNVPANPVGEELTDEELATIEGGLQIALSGIACVNQLVDVRPFSIGDI